MKRMKFAVAVSSLAMLLAMTSVGCAQTGPGAMSEKSMDGGMKSMSGETMEKDMDGSMETMPGETMDKDMDSSMKTMPGETMDKDMK